MNNKLTVILIILLSISAIAQSVKWERSEDCRQPQLGSRKRVASQTLLFAEAQLKYSLFQNYLHYWIDRPLFFDRATRHGEHEYSYFTKEALPYEIDAVRWSGLDGLGSFVLPQNKYSAFKTLDQWLREEQLPFQQLPQLNYGVTREAVEMPLLLEAFELLLGSPAVPRIDGKVVLGSYNLGNYSLDEHRAMKASIVEHCGSDQFVILGEIENSFARKLYDEYDQTQALSADLSQEYKKQLQAMLDIFGGVQVRVYPLKLYLREHDGDYTTTPCARFFAEYSVPILQELLAEEQNKNKIIGLIFGQGYINHLSGMNHGEYGTRTLREAFEQSLKLNPDLITLFEWNEVNENTCFQPTVYNGLATQRLLHYYSRLCKELPPAPMRPEDNLSVPNFILTYRAALKIGEALRFEILHIPDGNDEAIYQIQLKLLDGQGQIVVSFPEETFSGDQLKAISYRLASEAFSAEPFLCPELFVNGQKYDTFSHLRFSSSVSWNYKEIRQSLRDLLPVRNHRLELALLPDGRFSVTAALECDEPLASLEILDHEDEICAVDPSNEFDLEKNYLFKAAFTTQAKYRQRPAGTIRLKNVDAWKFRPVFQANTDHWKWKWEGDIVKVSNVYFWAQEAAFFFTVPKKSAMGAELEIDFNKGIGLHIFSISQLLRDGRFSKALYTDDNPLRVELSRVDNLPDVPPRIKKNNASLNTVICSANPFPLVSLRAIAESGRIYRSAPVMPKKPSGAKQTYTVFSDTAGKPVDVQVFKEALPYLDYTFSPNAGSALLNRFAPFFDAQLGGGFYYMEAFSRANVQPPEGHRVPKWVQEDGRWVLEFDGRANYINFSRESFPQASFTLEFELKPESTQSMILFRHFNSLLGSLSLYMDEENTLRGGWGDKEVKTHRFDTGMKIPAGEWSEVSVSYDFRILRFRVNGQHVDFPFNRRAYAFKPAIFGGHSKKEFGVPGDIPFFKGKLRKLCIKHYVEHGTQK